jgi:hypothetical protein
MCVERILLVARCLPGYVPAVRECVLVSQALGLGGFSHLLHNHGRLSFSGFEGLALSDDEKGVAIDGANMHAWLLAPIVADLAVDLARRNGSAEVRVHNVDELAELETVCALVVRQGAIATFAGDGCLRVSNAPRPRTLAQWDPLLYAAIRHGFPVEESLWRAVYELSNTALAPDSIVSRRHAGPVILQDDGTLLGRPPQDDDFDFNMLRKVAHGSKEHS